MRESKAVNEALASAVNKKKGPEHQRVLVVAKKDAQDSGGGGLRIPATALERRRKP
jgi:hypothetical protein